MIDFSITFIIVIIQIVLKIECSIIGCKKLNSPNKFGQSKIVCINNKYLFSKAQNGITEKCVQHFFLHLLLFFASLKQIFRNHF